MSRNVDDPTLKPKQRQKVDLVEIRLQQLFKKKAKAIDAESERLTSHISDVLTRKQMYQDAIDKMLQQREEMQATLAREEAEHRDNMELVGNFFYEEARVERMLEEQSEIKDQSSRTEDDAKVVDTKKKKSSPTHHSHRR
jgi:hypothetical protein